jgi:release factor glutamine methyltransferase
MIARWCASESEIERLALWADRLNANEPVQYVLGEAHFLGLALAVDRRVLIPRPETEELVFLMKERVGKLKEGQRKVLDVGTGSGAIALGWKSAFPSDEVMGLDASADALDVAKSNGAKLHLEVDWILGDILPHPSPGVDTAKPFDIIFSNPPYIPDTERLEMEKNVVNWEPHQALFVPDEDDLVFYRRIISGCEDSHWLKPEGWLAFECHRDRVEHVAALFHDAWGTVEQVRDLQGNWRMIFAQRHTASA